MENEPSLPLSFTKPKSEGPDCNSRAQSVQQAPEMASVKLEDCSQTLGLNVNVKEEVKEEDIETFVYHGPPGELKEEPVEQKVFLLKDKGNRKQKGMEKETEKKRHRFTPGDEDLIILGVLRHWEDLFGAQAHIRPRGSKTATWNIIAETLTRTSAVARCGDDVRKKYNLIRSQIKQKVSSIRALSTQTGGGPNTVPELTDLEQQLLSRMAENVTGLDPTDLGFEYRPTAGAHQSSREGSYGGLSQGDISSSGPPPAAEEGIVESALPSVTMEVPSTSPSTPWPAPTVPHQPISSRPTPVHSIHSQSINQMYFIKPFLHQQLSQSALQIPSLKPQIASNADALSGSAPQPITSRPAPSHSIHSGSTPQPITSCPAPSHSIHSGPAPQPITSGGTPQGPQAKLLQHFLDTQTQQIHVTQTAQHIHQALYDLLEKAHETQKAHLDVEKNRLQLDRERLRVETERLQVERERLQLEKDRLGEGEAREVSGSVVLEHQTPMSSRTASASSTLPLGSPSVSMSSNLTLVSTTAPHFDVLLAPLPVIPTHSTQPSQTSPACTSPTVTIPAPTSPALTSPAPTSPALTSPAPTSPALTSPALTSPTLTIPAPTSPTLTISARSLIPPTSRSVKRRVRETVQPWPAPTAKNKKHQ